MGGAQISAVLVMSLVVAIVVVASAWVQRSGSARTGTALPAASFGVQDSWLSAFVLVFSLVAALAGGGGWFSVLALFFAILVGLSPLAYRSFSGSDASQGSVGGFLLAAVLCLWAAYGFILTFIMLVSATLTGPESALAILLVMVVLVISLPLIAAYGFARVSAVLKSSRSGSVSFL